MDHDQKVDVIIDVLLDVRWILVVENIYRVNHYEGDPPERESCIAQSLHLTHSARHPIAYCGKNVTDENDEHEFHEKTLLPDSYQYESQNCPTCVKAYFDNLHRIFPELHESPR